MRVLVVEDEQKVAEFIKKGLEENSYKVDTAHDGVIAKHLAFSNQYDLIILDIIIPKLNGIELAKELRVQKINTPILMLTALSKTDDKVTGFDSGADDYLTKPFEFRELLARVKALTKRNIPEAQQSVRLLEVADLEMNLDSYTVTRAGQKIDLTAKEFSLLEYFVRNQGKAISRAEIAEKVWGLNFDTGTNVIDVYVNFLRKKVDKSFDKKLIHTLIGMGYILRVE
ncbi:MAG: response regulator transcription factor [Opitutaceae bacterium]|nr:response regulator transcription factor [Cytophagales bacterium]